MITLVKLGEFNSPDGEVVHEVKVGGRIEFVISGDHTWLPGCFDSEQAAKLAFNLAVDDLQELQDAANERAGGHGGVISLRDVAGRVK